jgi:hypothetical protein
MDSLYFFVVSRLLPKRLVAQVFIYVVAKVTTGKYGNTDVPELTCLEAFSRWEE